MKRFVLILSLIGVSVHAYACLPVLTLPFLVKRPLTYIPRALPKLELVAYEFEPRLGRGWGSCIGTGFVRLKLRARSHSGLLKNMGFRIRKIEPSTAIMPPDIIYSELSEKELVSIYWAWGVGPWPRRDGTYQWDFSVQAVNSRGQIGEALLVKLCHPSPCKE
jgi:hypothetical protein